MTRTELPFLTKIAKASSKSDSIRTTIPKEIAGSFNLEIHDILIWEIDKKLNAVIVKKWDGQQ